MKNYCTIFIDGQIIGIKFGIPAIRQLSDKNILLGDSRDNYTELGLAHVLYAGYCNNNLIKGVQDEFDIYAFVEYVEDCILTKQTDDLLNMLQVFNTSKVVKELVNLTQQAEENKKKAQEIINSPSQ